MSQQQFPHRQARTNGQRSKSQQHPVHQKLRPQRTAVLRTPNAVEGLVYRTDQHYGGNAEEHDTDGGQIAGVVLKSRQITAHRIRTLRHQITVYQLNDRRRQIVEHRKGRQNNQCDGQHRHQRQQRSKRQTGRHLRHVHLVKPLVKKAGKPEQTRFAHGLPRW